MVRLNPEFSFGVVFKATDLNTGKFYIGETTVKEKWNNGYLGSGRKWKNWYESHQEHEYSLEPLFFEYKDINELYEFEANEIRKYSEQKPDGKWIVTDPLCMNVKVEKQSYQVYCPECGGYSNIHFKTCSKFKAKRKCEECGNSVNKHKHYCSQFKQLIKCPECGNRGKHKKHCSKHRESTCQECGGISGKHRKGCSKFINLGVCPECGYSLQSRRHAKDCSQYKEIKKCPECGSKSAHKIWCSKSSRNKPI